MATMRIWTDGTHTVTAQHEKSARRKLEEMAGCAVGSVRIDDEAEAWDELPDCACGWRGQAGWWPRRGDRCPACGAGLD